MVCNKLMALTIVPQGEIIPANRLMLRLRWLLGLEVEIECP